MQFTVNQLLQRCQIDYEQFVGSHDVLLSAAATTTDLHVPEEYSIAHQARKQVSDGLVCMQSVSVYACHIPPELAQS